VAQAEGIRRLIGEAALKRFLAGLDICRCFNAYMEEGRQRIIAVSTIMALSGMGTVSPGF
jgi:hypothetical protein